MVYIVANKDDLDKKLEEAGDKLVVVDFFATWCGPCKMIEPQFVELAEQETDIVFLKVNVDEAEDVAMAYDVSSMPTFVFIKNKTRLGSFSGASLDKIKSHIAQFK